MTFIVGTGRCGSTMLSRILRMHPEVLSMSEFFCTVRPGTDELPDEVIDGRRLWDVLSSPEPSVDATVRDGLATPELCYPYETGRFTVETGIPRISHMTLPMLTDDPDALFADLAGEVPTWPGRPSWEQVRVLFEYLAGVFGRSVIAERTAGSAMYASWLRRHFTDARFVHMYRDGPSCALSMSTHPAARPMALMEEAGLLDGGEAGLAAAGRAAESGLLELVQPPFDMRRIMDHPAPSLAAFGRLWSRMIQAAVEALSGLGGETLMTLRYDDLLGRPWEMLASLAEFLGVPPRPEWLAGARRMIDSARVNRVGELDESVLAKLRDACEPGTRALAGTTQITFARRG
ncbi:MAG: sulfotransferase [Nocardiopsaceae bacterium]|nr:sulfotransferase [Nocardiopsaceae bacterium]